MRNEQNRAKVGKKQKKNLATLTMMIYNRN